MKTCRICGLPEGPKRRISEGRKVCNPCRGKQYYTPERRETIILKSREHYQRNRESVLAWKKEYYRQNPNKRREESLRRLYGLTMADFNEMVAAQGGRCAICEKQPRRLDVDHCHTNGHVRKLLCGNCNKGIGCLQEDPEILARAIEYLDAHAA